MNHGNSRGSNMYPSASRLETPSSKSPQGTMRRTMHALGNVENMALLVEVWKSHLKMLQTACKKTHTCHPGPIQAPRGKSENRPPRPVAQSGPDCRAPGPGRGSRAPSGRRWSGPDCGVRAVGPRPADDGRSPTVRAWSGQSGPDRPTTVGPRLSGPGQGRADDDDGARSGSRAPTGRRSGPTVRARSGQSGPVSPTMVGPRLWGQGSRAPTGRRRSVPNCQGPVGAVGPRPADDGRAPTVRAWSGQSGPDRSPTVRARSGSRAPTGRRRSGPDCQGPVGAVGPRPADDGRAPTVNARSGQSGPDRPKTVGPR